MAKTDYGNPIGWNIGTINGGDGCGWNNFDCIDTYVNQYFSPYLKTIINTKKESPALDYGDKYNWPFGSSYYYYIDLTSGQRIIFGLDGNKYQVVAYTVDINGAKKGPNKWGRDLFRMMFSPKHDKLFFNGSYTILYSALEPQNYQLREKSRTDILQNCNSTSRSWCGALIFFDGWKIDNDYPW